MDPAIPLYDEAYYRHYDGQRYERNDEWMTLFRHFASRIARTLHPVRTLDAGCAIGLLVEALTELDIDAQGFDISEFAIGEAPPEIQDRLWVQSLTEPIKDRYDLVTCIEVIEHLPASEALDAVENLCSATDTILLSSTPIEHEEPTHLNVQPPEYWSALFATQGFFRDTEYDPTYISPWAVLYRRRRPELSEVVRSYDRAFWRVLDENIRVRQALLRETDARESLAVVLTDDEWDEVHASDDPAAALGAVAARVGADRGTTPAVVVLEAERDRLRGELVEERRRVLTLRDELAGASARAGEMSARLVQAEGEFAAAATLRQRYVELEARHDAVVTSSTWRWTWKLMAPYRRLRGRS